MNDKLKSRKFIVWITSTVFVTLSFIAYIIVKDIEVMSVTKTFAESWGWISALYIGGNEAQKCLVKQEEK